jgi:hypothetical protein
VVNITRMSDQDIQQGTGTYNRNCYRDPVSKEIAFLSPPPDSFQRYRLAMNNDGCVHQRCEHRCDRYPLSCVRDVDVDLHSSSDNDNATKATLDKS